MEAPPPGWYTELDDPSLARYWDGDTWTGQRREAVDEVGTDSPSPTGPGATVGRVTGQGLTAARRIADSARRSPLAQRISGSAASASRSVVETAKDPARRQAAVELALPALDAALEGASVRNKKGEIKAWRIAHAVTHPRKTVSGVGKQVTATAVRQASPRVGPGAADQAGVAPVVEDIRGEWTLGDPGMALDRWREGSDRFELADGDDAEEMLASARLMCELLEHCLVGKPIVDDGDAIIETVGNVLTAALNSAREQGWEDLHAKIVRLALAVARRFGVQPEELGGNGELNLIFDDTYHRMYMAMSIAPSRWSCDLSVWFADG